MHNKISIGSDSISKRIVPNKWHRYKLANSIWRITARGNILLQTGRVATDVDFQKLKERVLAYEFKSR